MKTDTEKSPEASGKIPHIVQAMSFKEDPSSSANQQAEQVWEAQWQQFLRTVQHSHAGWGNTQLTDVAPWDNTRAFLAAFEQEAEVCRWPREEWVGRLLPALKGGMEQICCRLDAQERGDYGKVKAALLRGDAMRTESKRLHFRQCCYQEFEGLHQIYSHLQDLCRQWLKPEHRTKEQILELIIQEQFLAMLPPEVQNWVRECAPEDCVEVVALAEDFLMGHQSSKMQEQLGRANLKDKSVALERGGGTTVNLGNVNNSEGLLVPTPDIVSQPDQEGYVFSHITETGETMSSIIPGESRVLDEIKIESYEDADSEAGGSFEALTEDSPEADPTSPEACQESPRRKLRPREPQGGKQDGSMPQRTSVRLHGESSIPATNKKQKEKQHLCKECGHRTYYLSDLLIHMNCHFMKVSSFETHQKIHTPASGLRPVRKAISHGGEGNHVSSEHRKRQATPPALAKPMEVHTGDRPQQCQDCGQSFRCLCRRRRIPACHRSHTSQFKRGGESRDLREIKIPNYEDMDSEAEGSVEALPLPGKSRVLREIKIPNYEDMDSEAEGSVEALTEDSSAADPMSPEARVLRRKLRLRELQGRKQGRSVPQRSSVQLSRKRARPATNKQKEGEHRCKVCGHYTYLCRTWCST